MSHTVECPACQTRFDVLLKRFIPPSVEEVAAYCAERGNHVDSQQWHDFYTSKNWMIGKNKMKDWMAAVRTWEKGSTLGTAANGTACPLCEKYRIDPGAKVCSTCGPYCRKCGEQTPNLTIVLRKDKTKSAVCVYCLENLRSSRP